MITPPLLPSASPVGSQPSPDQIAALRSAEKAARKIQRAARFANGDAWSIAIIGGLTLLTGFNDLSAILLAGLMGFVAWREFQGAAGIRRLTPAAASRLAFNQIIFATGLVLYSLWQLHIARTTPSELSKALHSDPAMEMQFGSFADLEQSISTMVYVGVIIATILTQGSIALYYASRQKMIERFIRETPPWVVDFHRKS